MKTTKSSGFTLFEMMLVVAIIGVVTAIAAPSIEDSLRTQRVRAASSAMMATIMTARSEAMKYGTVVSIVPGKVGSAVNLNNGWCIVFGDTADCVLALPAANVMHAQVPFPSVQMPTGARLVFSGNGRVPSRTTFAIADDRGVTRRCVSVEVSGAVGLKEGTC